MDKKVKKEIKKLLLLDSMLETQNSISKILDEVEKELDELLGKPKEDAFDIEDFFNIFK